MRCTDDPIDARSLERIIPDHIHSEGATGFETLDLHLNRYQFAKENLVPGRLLDLACGVGYGTALLSDAPQITGALGIDISNAAVQYAGQRYGSERVSFQCSDALQFSPVQLFENVVSLETIEHVDEPVALFGHLVSLIVPGGRFIASVPVTPSVDANPHHKCNFSEKRFRKLGETFRLQFLRCFMQVQPFSPVAIVLRREARTVNLRRNLALFYLQNPSHLVQRVWSTVRDGFVNKYMTIVWEKPK